jgi:cell division protein ftsA
LAKERRENSTSHKIFRELKNFFGKMISEDE